MTASIIFGDKPLTIKRVPLHNPTEVFKFFNSIITFLGKTNYQLLVQSYIFLIQLYHELFYVKSITLSFVGKYTKQVFRNKLIFFLKKNSKKKLKIK